MSFITPKIEQALQYILFLLKGGKAQLQTGRIVKQKLVQQATAASGNAFIGTSRFGQLCSCALCKCALRKWEIHLINTSDKIQICYFSDGEAWGKYCLLDICAKKENCISCRWYFSMHSWLQLKNTQLLYLGLISQVPQLTWNWQKYVEVGEPD